MKMEQVKVLGVCAWLADRFNLNVSGLRWAFILATILGVGSPIIIYLVLALVKPREF